MEDLRSPLQMGLVNATVGWWVETDARQHMDVWTDQLTSNVLKLVTAHR